MQITMIGNKNIDWFLPLLGPEPSAHQIALGVVLDDRPVAAAVFSREKLTCYIDHILVEEQSRRQGVGSFLLTEAMDAFRHTGVTEFFAFYPKDDALSAFLRKLGFFCSESDPVIEAPCRKMIESETFAGFKKKYEMKRIEGIRSLAKTSIEVKKELMLKFISMDFDPVLFTADRYDEDISFCYLDGEHSGAMVLVKRQGGDILVTMLATFGEDVHLFPRFLIYSLDEVLKVVSADARVIYVCRNEKIRHTLQVFFEDKLDSVEEKECWSAVYMVQRV
ncbi:MAG: GNAT family N-acetyltransferase [Lachnospiraceae bacterium]|nr:GNAT family N-acetyltransferase [Lachnospiraceae bacterium]